MHLDEGTIHAWLDGALDAEEAGRVERHASECATCAAAVAEARGLVAGASRILTALDGVPGGVVPKTAAAAVRPRARRGPSLWTTLHLTPARAAAAAVVVLAAGTALVLNNAPKAARSAITLANSPVDSAVAMRRAAPLTLPLAAPDSVASRAVASPTRRSSPSSRVSSIATGKATPARAEELRVADSTRGAGNLDSIATKKESAMARSALADNAIRGAAAGAAPRAVAAAPPSAVTQRYGAAKRFAEPRSTAGCYEVTTDSTVGLPPRLWLDSSLVAQTAMLQRSRAADAAAAVVVRHGVSEIVSDARRSIAGAYWAQRADGSIRLSLPAIALDVDLRPASPSTLVGATMVGNRSVSVTLRRVDCSQ